MVAGGNPWSPALTDSLDLENVVCTVTALLKMFFTYYNCMYWAKITLNIKELMIDVDVEINDLLPFCSKVSSWIFFNTC